jgi:hypothetical protein
MVILPSSYFGSIAYFKELVKHETVLIEAKEHFPKQTYRNRCDIVAGDGMLSISIPTKKNKGSKTPTDEVQLSNDENWRIRHWRSLTSAYQSAPYFEYYSIEVKELLFQEELSLLNFNMAITQRILDWLDIDTKLELTSTFSPIKENDHRIILLNKDQNQTLIKAPYIQVFPGENNYKESISILDAVFCLGPLARNLIKIN